MSPWNLDSDSNSRSQGLKVSHRDVKMNTRQELVQITPRHGIWKSFFGLDSVLWYGTYTAGTEAANALSGDNMPRHRNRRR